MYQVLKKQAQKDNISEFEESREKRVDKHLNSSTLCLGPFLSADKANLTYIYKSNRPMGAGASSKASDKQGGKNQAQDKGAILGKLLQALLRIRERCLMKPDEPVY